ncbi:hypothetical protein LEP1GSC008_3304 [Leptospira kirschneri serovar Bulgarica str. Nikolaevo]|uniref:Uncharacterized protein n=1 Tax=Leptospira kirschneri serovar Bulgarica str. Nikolaevo TaxID=1240687 RepID=M6F7S3_9LEPT|nr:hypothetical protein LEP1GSC008_3304 [Leptospira kirschneri serovar Bulgarica str. Nikolaevo]
MILKFYSTCGFGYDRERFALVTSSIPFALDFIELTGTTLWDKSLDT